MYKYLIISSLFGFFVPIIFVVAESVLKVYYYKSDIPLYVQMFFWPSSIMMMAVPDREDNFLPFLWGLFISATVNLVFYTLAFCGIWYGLKEKIWVFYITIFLVIMVYYKLYTI